jgi:hypothetical protein
MGSVPKPKFRWLCAAALAIIAAWPGACVLDEDLGDAPADGGLNGDGDGGGDGGGDNGDGTPDGCNSGGELDFCGQIDEITTAGLFVRITYTPANSGPGTESVSEGENRVWVHRGEPPTIEDVLAQNEGQPGVNSDQTQVISLASVRSAGTAYVLRDALGAVEESNEENNLAGQSWGRDSAVFQMTAAPALSASSVPIDSSFTVTLTIGTDVGRVTVRLENADDDSFSLGGTQVSSLGDTTVDIVITLGGSGSNPPGSSYYVSVITDGGSGSSGGAGYVVPDSSTLTYQRRECDNVNYSDFGYACLGDENVLDSGLAVPWITVTP